jgi:hypothetical protein
VVNKILSRDPYPNLEAVDPLSSSEKNEQKKRIQMQVEAREQLIQLKQQTGVVLDIDPEQLPETLEESEILLETNIKTDAEIAAQIGTNMTLSWNNFNDGTYRRCVNDLASIGMAVVKRRNDPNTGIVLDYVDPARFVHSYTEDPNFDDIIYAGSIKRISIDELRRISNGEIDEETLKKIAHKVRNRTGPFINSAPWSDLANRAKPISLTNQPPMTTPKKPARDSFLPTSMLITVRAPKTKAKAEPISALTTPFCPSTK